MATALNFGSGASHITKPVVEYSSLINENGGGAVTIADASQLPPAIAQEVGKAVATINFNDQNSITNFGVSCQSGITTLSNSILSNVKTKDTGEVGVLLGSLVKGIKDIDVSTLDGKKKGGIFGFFNKVGDPIKSFMVKQQSVTKNMETITKDLNNKRTELLDSVKTLDGMYGATLDHFNNLNVFIYAGYQKLNEERATTLQTLEAKATSTQDHVDVQTFNDYKKTLDRFDKRLSDMVMARHIAIMQGPQIRLMQNNASTLAEEIQNSILNVVPAFQQQLVLAVECYKAQKAVESQKLLKTTVNDLMAKNSELLKQTSIAVAGMAQDSLIDFSTVTKMQNDLIESIESVKRIEEEGSKKRAEQAVQLQQKEQEFAQKLLGK